MASFVLDENVDRRAFEDLQRAGFKVEQIGVEVGAGQHYDDERVIQYLHRSKQKTLITHNVKHFYLRRLQHANYCLLGIEGDATAVGQIARRVLRLKQFCTKTQRMGKVIRASTQNVWYVEMGSDVEHTIALE
jgi:hypothetical protein